MFCILFTIFVQFLICEIRIYNQNKTWNDDYHIIDISEIRKDVYSSRKWVMLFFIAIAIIAVILDNKLI